jgi:hypothetical protein
MGFFSCFSQLLGILFFDEEAAAVDGVCVWTRFPGGIIDPADSLDLSSSSNCIAAAARFRDSDAVGRPL